MAHEYHQRTDSSFYLPVERYSAREIRSERVQKIAALALEEVTFDFEQMAGTVGVAFPQLQLPEELTCERTPQREQRAGFAVIDILNSTKNVYFNPKVLQVSQSKNWGFEACLSVDEAKTFKLVPRPNHIRAAWHDIDGIARKGAFRDENARFWLHEAAHVLHVPKTIHEQSPFKEMNYSLDEVLEIYDRVKKSKGDVRQALAIEAVRVVEVAMNDSV